ncbi:unnamed protein product [Soboliphyme baturini]|uniref:C2 domain-containing protein n=1 Tax=Soboliphyme baturini TaxID=241478 RepID=A0A183IWN7_9BILA|nr:unnamed protein product [Soboliphyme baturini]
MSTSVSRCSGGDKVISGRRKAVWWCLCVTLASVVPSVDEPGPLAIRLPHRRRRRLCLTPFVTLVSTGHAAWTMTAATDHNGGGRPWIWPAVHVSGRIIIRTTTAVNIDDKQANPTWQRKLLPRNEFPRLVPSRLTIKRGRIMDSVVHIILGKTHNETFNVSHLNDEMTTYSVDKQTT